MENLANPPLSSPQQKEICPLAYPWVTFPVRWSLSSPQ